MKKNGNNNKVVKSAKSAVKSAPVSAPVIESAIQVSAPVSAPVIVSAPVSAPVSAEIQMGVPNLTSRRINPRAQVRAWRIANNQRKGVFSGGAKYYVQGGELMIDPTNQRSRFEVAIEIPFVDLYLAKVELVARRGTEVARIA